jgi:hypothetical protein
MTTTMCSICGIVSVPAGSLGYGSDPGSRTGPPGKGQPAPAAPAAAAAATLALSTPRLLMSMCPVSSARGTRG